jgi:alpha,alpha-trehalose phosphorylase
MMFIPYDERLGVHPQAEGFTSYAPWNFAATPPEAYPLLLHAPYFDLYRKQVIKQPDLVLAMHLRSDFFTPEQKDRNFTYYERMTVRDSSLSDGTEAVIAAEVGHLDLAYDYLVEAALLDLNDLQHNTRDGIHIAAVAGAWIALVEGFGGMRIMHNGLGFAPRLPADLQRLTFKLLYRGRRLSVRVSHTKAEYSLLEGESLRLRHYEAIFTLDAGEPAVLPIPPVPPRERPRQPPGREPFRRHA